MKLGIKLNYQNFVGMMEPSFLLVVLLITLNVQELSALNHAQLGKCGSGLKKMVRMNKNLENQNMKEILQEHVGKHVLIVKIIKNTKNVAFMVLEFTQILPIVHTHMYKIHSLTWDGILT